MSKARVLEVAVASTLNKKMRLTDAMLFGVEARQIGGHSDPNLSYTLSLDPVVWTRFEYGVAAVYSVTVILEHVEGTNREPLAKISVSMRLTYASHPSFEANDEPALEDYLGIVGWLHAWPYLRAEVQTLSGRLGFPPLVLDVLHAGQTASIAVERMKQPSASAPSQLPAKADSARPKAKRKTVRKSRAR